MITIIVLALMALVAFVHGTLDYFSAKTVQQQQVGMIAFVVAAVYLSAAFVVEQLRAIRKEAKTPPQLYMPASVHVGDCPKCGAAVMALPGAQEGRCSCGAAFDIK